MNLLLLTELMFRERNALIVSWATRFLPCHGLNHSTVCDSHQLQGLAPEVRGTDSVMKHHDQRQPGKKRVYFIHTSIIERSESYRSSKVEAMEKY